MDDLNKIEVAPPTWEEVMNEKISTNEEDNKKPSKMKFFQHFSLTSTKDKSSKVTNDFALIEVQSSDICPTEKGEEQNIDTENANEIPIVSCFRKFINTLQLISAITTITSDLIIWVCCLCMFVLGCLMQDALNNNQEKGSLELVRVLLSHKNKFGMFAQLFIASGLLYMVIVVPFGIIGVTREKRILLKFHNICLFLYLLPELVLYFFLIFRYLHTDKSNDFKKDFQKEVARYLQPCRTNGDDYQKMECCCVLVKNNATNSCWKYNKLPIPSKNNFNEKTLYEVDCTKNIDLFNRFKGVLQEADYMLPIFMLIQAVTLFFGWLVAKGIPEYNPDDSVEAVVEVEKPQKKKKEKKKINIFYKVLFFFAVKKVFYVILFILLSIFYKVFHAWAKETWVTVEGIPKPINLWDLVKAVGGKD